MRTTQFLQFVYYIYLFLIYTIAYLYYILPLLCRRRPSNQSRQTLRYLFRSSYSRYHVNYSIIDVWTYAYYNIRWMGTYCNVANTTIPYVGILFMSYDFMLYDTLPIMFYRIDIIIRYVFKFLSLQYLYMIVSRWFFNFLKLLL